MAGKDKDILSSAVVSKKEKIVPENKNDIGIYSLNDGICNKIYD